jgi:two-component system, NtrC family, response regulator GlrR
LSVFKFSEGGPLSLKTAMISQRALLLNVSAESRLCSTLQTILNAHFQVNIVGEPKSDSPFEPSTAARSFRDVIRRFDPLVIFLILSSEISDKIKILESVRKEGSSVPIIAVVEPCEPQRVFELLRAGAADFITSPLSASDVLPRTWKLVKPAYDRGATQLLGSGPALQQLIGRSPDFLAQLQKIPLIANCDANVLIEGETGTGKEVYARAIHYCSPRAGRPFIPVNCGAIPLELVENELFGHERGAFTSAFTLQTGLIDEANGGTLFLDEIDCLPPLAQVKLLRFLQEKEYKPLGSARIRRADVRIIAASNLKLEQAVADGTMRQDLFYRLNIISLTLPPLRERREDIPLLARYFLAKYTAQFNKEIAGLAQDAMHLLVTYSWPGNVRELEHVIERSTVMAEGLLLQAKDLILLSSQAGVRCESLQEAKAKEIARFEKDYIQGLLVVCGGNITRAAQVAQKNRRAFWQLIQKHRIDVAKFKSTLS